MTVCYTLQAACPGGNTVYAADYSCEKGNETDSSIYEELVEIGDAKRSRSEDGNAFSSDTAKPTLEATLSGGIITVVAKDTESGIQKITVNGTDYTTFTDDALRIQLTQSDFATEQFVFTATDEAGNVSDRYVMDNPYYNWPNGGSAETGTNTAAGGTNALSRASQGTPAGASASTATTVSGGTGSTASSRSSDGSTVSSPLPQKAEATQPTEATGTVIDRSGTAAKAVEASGEEVEKVTQTAEQDGKGFYTIQTKSGKTFYLIVDNTKNTENVYLLTEVSEQDLMNFNLPDTVKLPDAEAVRAELEKRATVTPLPTAEVTQKEPKPVMPEKKNPLLSKFLIGLIIGVVIGAGYYFKFYRPKHEQFFYEEDDEDEASDYEREQEEEAPYTETLEEEEE